ncbi:MAG TPA: DUF3775 domain-containing protein [Magnetospirillaceae bacterium]|nr:DUF3775 domain-containing protein [Magnetospirillaceae bacterium]
MEDPYRPPLPLDVDLDTLSFIIVKAREFDAKVPTADPDPGSNPSDDGGEAVLSDYPGDATRTELQSAIDNLNDDEISDVVALAWVGRGDYDERGWGEARILARERHRRQSSDYLLGMPALGDYLEEGLAVLGYPTEDIGLGHL